MQDTRATCAESLCCPVELRETGGGPTLTGTILQEGRASSGGRLESFCPLSVCWPADGVAVLDAHGGAALARAVPTRDVDGSIRIETPATPEILEAFATRRFFSVEFRAISEVLTKAGHREITRALVDAAAMVSSPEYQQAIAELRDRDRRRVWL